MITRKKHEKSQKLVDRLKACDATTLKALRNIAADMERVDTLVEEMANVSAVLSNLAERVAALEAAGAAREWRI